VTRAGAAALPLLEALDVRRGDVVAAVGAGGKTSLVYALAAQARDRGWTVLVTTTTHMGARPADPTRLVLVESEGAGDTELERGLAERGLVTLLGCRIRSDKLRGLPPERVDALARRADLVLVEADGARGRSLKLPSHHEPVLPSATTLLVALAGLDALGAPLDSERVHRLEQVLEATGREPGSAIDAELIQAALSAPRGYLAHRPAAGRAAVFLNKYENAAARSAAAALGPRLVPPWDRVVAGSAAQGLGRVVAKRPGRLLS
jgi:probable selenium-dependent hydroxylase accessory protein YqeC